MAQPQLVISYVFRVCFTQAVNGELDPIDINKKAITYFQQKFMKPHLQSLQLTKSLL